MNQPYQTTFLANTGTWESVGGGYYHTLAISSDGKLYGTGANDLPQVVADLLLEPFPGHPIPDDKFTGCLLGLDNKVDNTHTYIVSSFSLIPHVSSSMFDGPGTVRVAAPNNFTKVSASITHSAAIAGSTLYVTGFNHVGQLGLGTSVLSCALFTPIDGSFKDVAAGLLHTCALSSDGVAFTTGLNYESQCGFNDLAFGILNNFTPITPARVRLAGNITPVEQPRFDKVFCGNNFTILLSSVGNGNYNMFTAGTNLSGAIGLGTSTMTEFFVQNTSNIVWRDVACKSTFTIATDKDGKIYSTGFNNAGQLGNNSQAMSFSFIDISNIGPWNSLPIKSIAAGYEHTIVIDSENHAYSVGRNEEGQLGTGDGNVFTGQYITQWQVLSGSFKEAYAGAFTSFLIYGPYLGTIR